MDNASRHTLFSFFNEIGIIAQLSRAAMEARLPKGLTLPHFSVINHLIRVKDGQTPLALAKAFQVPKTTMTHTLSGLLDHGLVDMRPNPKDGRSKTVWLTEAGRQFRETAIRSIDPDMSAIKSAIPEEKIAEILPILAEIRSFMDAYRDEN
ncbi:winged helix-turn-helix transcriptional regulator [Labrenzia sp. R4_1]|uniref:MarR family winged helix-turn-helix transcriptional regulator n=1 Tax=unclassified Labrenzia TaxID=2648686 RepID=UPI001ADAFEA9|nr:MULTISPECIES: MarR family winged helix-turn-helix transcriptional regulator [unclassified Labrenzia]MBO9419357.1 winged helix-turn-helix transcriptional regulator [Labrenzia sp. R4_2]MBO9426394.1 winged helix-turn-helix transcriptional regulator [Labrenzia sp. R4_1]